MEQLDIYLTLTNFLKSVCAQPLTLTKMTYYCDRYWAPYLKAIHCNYCLQAYDKPNRLTSLWLALWAYSITWK